MSSVYHIVFLVLSVMGLLYHGYFFGFHFLHIVVNNDILLRVARSFYELSRHRRKVYFADQNRGRQSYEDHCTILEAIEERRVGLAEQQMNAHLSRTVEAWQSLLGETKVTKR